VKNIVGMGEVSAWGLPGEAGVLVLDVPQASRAAAAGLRKGDVVLRLDDKQADTLRDLQRLSAESPAFRDGQHYHLAGPAGDNARGGDTGSLDATACPPCGPTRTAGATAAA